MTNRTLGEGRIAILHHASVSAHSLKHYALATMIPTWEADGYDVIHLFGTRESPDADVLLVHVDLSVVPDDYLDFARRYAVALNAEIRDIRRTTYSSNLLHSDDNWDGPVIVKSNLNFGGIPESRHSFRGRLRRRILGLFRPATEYPVYPSLRAVPASVFANPELVVERFIPEICDGLYALRMYQFCGDRHTSIRLHSPEPIIRASRSVRSEDVPVHPDIEELRWRMQLDYGKIDYVVHDGRAVAIDVNKTQGGGGVQGEHTRNLRRHRAIGMYSYFRDTPE